MRMSSRVLLQLGAGTIAMAISALAGTVPCNMVAGVNVVVVRGPNASYCVTDYGWSNGLFPGDTTITDYDASKNVLGTSAQYISYDLNGTPYGSWLTPYIGGYDGTLSFTSTSATPDFSIDTPVSNLGTDRATSIITDGRVRIAINTQALVDGLRMTFAVTNLDATHEITNMSFVEYFNYFPNGATNTNLGTLSYGPVREIGGGYVDGLWATAVGYQPGSGGVCGGWGSECGTPSAWGIGDPTAIFAGVSDGTAFNSAGFASNNAAGVLKWNSGATLAVNGLAGDTQNFTMEIVPEPGTWTLLAAGFGLVAVARHRRCRA